MTREQIRGSLPRWLERYLWFFETAIEDSVARFAEELPAAARVLDAGSGEGQYRKYFLNAQYVGIDLGVGDQKWDYSALDVIGDLTTLPFATASFDACLNIVTLEHVKEPSKVVREISRTLKQGGRLLMVVPQDWEVHQSPHDYFRYTRHGLEALLQDAGFENIELQPGGGYFRLMGRRMLNGIQFFRGLWAIPAALLLAPAGLIFPLFDGLDQERNFTLGYLCTATKR